MKASRLMNLDRLGTIASAICAVHCALTGLAFGLLSVVGLGFLGSPQAELAFIGVTLTIGSVAVVHGAKKHHSYVPAAFFVGGLVCLLVAHFAVGQHSLGTAHSHDHEHSPLGSMFSVLGGCCFILFHVMNLRYGHRCGCDSCQHSQSQ